MNLTQHRSLKHMLSQIKLSLKPFKATRVVFRSPLEVVLLRPVGPPAAWVVLRMTILAEKTVTTWFPGEN